GRSRAAGRTVAVPPCLSTPSAVCGPGRVGSPPGGEPYRPLGFVTPGPYRHVRHPLYVGWLLAFWATPTMTVAHLLFAVTTTAYILIAIRLEERDLVEFHGERYAEYRRSVPMLVPRVRTTQPPRTKVARTEMA